MTSAGLVPLRWRSAVTLAAVSAVGVLAFGWPFLLGASTSAGVSHGSDAPLLFALVLPLLAAVVLAELTSGRMDAKTLAMLGMLGSVGSALRALGPAVAGLEPSFAVIILGGRVFGRGFGFVLGTLSILGGALVMGGVGPWLPFQMLAAGWVGFLAGCLPRGTGRFEVLVLAAYGAIAALGFGALINLWFWPFGSFGSAMSYQPGAGVGTNLAHYAVFYLATSLAWDIGRALLTCLLLAVAGPALLHTLRRAARRAAFDAPVEFRR